jgi:outer membrane protein assembly factor BamB
VFKNSSDKYFVGISDNSSLVFEAVDFINGSKKWEFLTDNRISTSTAIANDGTIYFGSDDN